MSRQQVTETPGIIWDDVMRVKPKQQVSIKLWAPRSSLFRLGLDLELKPAKKSGCILEICNELIPSFNSYTIHGDYEKRIMAIVESCIEKGRYRETDWVPDITEKLREQDLAISKDVLEKACTETIQFFAENGIELDNAMLTIKGVAYDEYQITNVICENLLKYYLGYLIAESCPIDKEYVENIIGVKIVEEWFDFYNHVAKKLRADGTIEAWQQQIDERRKSVQEKVLPDRR